VKQYFRKRKHKQKELSGFCAYANEGFVVLLNDYFEVLLIGKFDCYPVFSFYVTLFDKMTNQE